MASGSSVDVAQHEDCYLPNDDFAMPFFRGCNGRAAFIGQPMVSLHSRRRASFIVVLYGDKIWRATASSRPGHSLSHFKSGLEMLRGDGVSRHCLLMVDLMPPADKRNCHCDWSCWSAHAFSRSRYLPVEGALIDGQRRAGKFRR